MPEKRKRKHRRARIVAPNSVPGEARVLSFSFKFWQPEHPRFSFANCPHEFVAALLETMRFYSEMAVDQFVNEDDVEHRHTIKWVDTNEPDGFPGIDPDELGVDTAWQFSLHKVNGRAAYDWRVHGFVAEKTFHVVWLDDHHGLIGHEDKKNK